MSIYQSHLHLNSPVFTLIDHKDAMVAMVYKITQPNQDPLILKVCDRENDYWREVFFLKRLAGSLPVPRIVQLVNPEKNLHGAILMHCLPGTLLQIDDMTQDLAYEMGTNLALIHLHRLSGYGDPIQKPFYQDPRPYFRAKFKEGLEECFNHLPNNLIDHSQRFYEKHESLLESVDGPCIVHRDFRPGNLIVKEGKLQGIIDWAGARASFAEEDFCSIEHGEWLVHKNAFLSGYQSVRPLPDYQRLLPLLRLNRAVAILGFLVKCNTWNGRNGKLYQENLHFLETLFEQV